VIKRGVVFIATPAFFLEGCMRDETESSPDINTGICLSVNTPFKGQIDFRTY
jgi:hypothetical protein